MQYKILFFSFLFFVNFIVSAQNEQGVVKIKADKNVSELLKQKIEYNKTKETYKGYRIQLFYGSEKGANKEIDKFKSLFPDIPVKLLFSSPDWKVQAGNYHTKLDADRDLKEIKMDFPSAIVLQSEIELKE
jgi:hypothetical protein